MKETTLLSVEDRDVVLGLYKAAVDILSGKVITLVLDGKQCDVDPLSLPVRDFVTLYSSPKTTRKGMYLVSAKTEKPTVDRVLSTKEKLLRHLLLTYGQTIRPSTIWGENVALRYIPDNINVDGLSFSIEVLDRAEDDCYSLRFQVLLNDAKVKDPIAADRITRRHNLSIYSWLSGMVGEVSPLCNIINSSWNNN